MVLNWEHKQAVTDLSPQPGVGEEWTSATIEQLEDRGILQLSRGKVISNQDIERNPGDFPIYSSSITNSGLFGRYDDYMFDEELITWSVDGGGNFFYRPRHKFSVTNVAGIMRADTTRVDYRFLAAELALLHSRLAFDYQMKAHPSVIRKLYTLSLPSLHEQRAIAAALSDADALIAALDRLIAKHSAIKQATMQQLLTGHTRLPGFTGAWEVTALGERCRFYSGGTPSTSNSSLYGGDIRWITSSDMNQTRIREVEGRITEQGLTHSSAKMVNEGDLLLALYGATAGVAALTEISAAINQAVLAIIPREDNPEFLLQKLILAKSWITGTFTQGGQPNLSARIVKHLRLSFPPLPEQTAIAAVLSDMDAHIAALARQRDKTRALKQGMMQQLLTGRIRLMGGQP